MWKPCSPGLRPFTRMAIFTPPETSLSVAAPTTLPWASLRMARADWAWATAGRPTTSIASTSSSGRVIGRAFQRDRIWLLLPAQPVQRARAKLDHRRQNRRLGNAPPRGPAGGEAPPQPPRSSASPRLLCGEPEASPCSRQLPVVDVVQAARLNALGYIWIEVGTT